MAKFRVKYFGSNDVPVGLIRSILDEIDAELVIARPTTDAEIVEAGRDADGIIMHGSVPFTKEIIAQLKRTKVVCRTGVGVGVDVTDPEPSPAITRSSRCPTSSSPAIPRQTPMNRTSITKPTPCAKSRASSSASHPPQRSKIRGSWPKPRMRGLGECENNGNSF